LRRGLGLPSPGNWEALHRDIKGTLPSLHQFEGAKVDLSSVISQNFQVSHAIQWGVAGPVPNKYSFSAGYITERLLLHGQLDDELVLQGRANYNWVVQPQPAPPTVDANGIPQPPAGPAKPATSSTTKVQMQLGSTQAPDMIQLEHDHCGTDFALNLKAVNPNLIDVAPKFGAQKARGGGRATTGVYSASYLQSITRHLAVGLEYMWQRPFPEMEEAAMTYALRYAPTLQPGQALPNPATLPAGIPVGQVYPPVRATDPNRVFTATFAPANGAFHASWWQRINPRLEVASELQMLLTTGSPAAGTMGNRQALASVGFKLDTVSATIRSSIDTMGRVTTVLEEKLASGLSVLLSGEMDYTKGNGGAGRVGLGFVLEA
ncbi:hypothetical protein CXG81DRAFT_6790, partial [Caulochytrium protostelioides]